MGYSDNPASVRVDFFKESGKWYTTEAVIWTGNYNYEEPGNKKQLIHDAFAQSLRDHFKECPGRLSDMDAVCIHPYYEHKFPIMIKNGRWNK